MKRRLVEEVLASARQELLQALQDTAAAASATYPLTQGLPVSANGTDPLVGGLLHGSISSPPVAAAGAAEDIASPFASNTDSASGPQGDSSASPNSLTEPVQLEQMGNDTGEQASADATAIQHESHLHGSADDLLAMTDASLGMESTLFSLVGDDSADFRELGDNTGQTTSSPAAAIDAKPISAAPSPPATNHSEVVTSDTPAPVTSAPSSPDPPLADKAPTSVESVPPTADGKPIRLDGAVETAARRSPGEESGSADNAEGQLRPKPQSDMMAEVGASPQSPQVNGVKDSAARTPPAVMLEDKEPRNKPSMPADPVGEDSSPWKAGDGQDAVILSPLEANAVSRDGDDEMKKTLRASNEDAIQEVTVTVMGYAPPCVDDMGIVEDGGTHIECTPEEAAVADSPMKPERSEIVDRIAMLLKQARSRKLELQAAMEDSGEGYESLSFHEDEEDGVLAGDHLSSDDSPDIEGPAPSHAQPKSARPAVSSGHSAAGSSAIQCPLALSVSAAASSTLVEGCRIVSGGTTQKTMFSYHQPKDTLAMSLNAGIVKPWSDERTSWSSQPGRAQLMRHGGDDTDEELYRMGADPEEEEDSVLNITLSSNGALHNSKPDQQQSAWLKYRPGGSRSTVPRGHGKQKATGSGRESSLLFRGAPPGRHSNSAANDSTLDELNSSAAESISWELDSVPSSLNNSIADTRGTGYDPQEGRKGASSWSSRQDRSIDSEHEELEHSLTLGSGNASVASGAVKGGAIMSSELEKRFDALFASFREGAAMPASAPAEDSSRTVADVSLDDLVGNKESVLDFSFASSTASSRKVSRPEIQPQAMPQYLKTSRESTVNGVGFHLRLDRIRGPGVMFTCLRCGKGCWSGHGGWGRERGARRIRSERSIEHRLLRDGVPS